VRRAIDYKNGRLQEAPDTKLSCDRIAVAADLSDPSWSRSLQAAGFDPAARSFFLIEGLLMYLPKGAPEALLRDVAALMSPDSVVTGDTFVNCLAFTDQSFVRSLGTKWTFDFYNDDAIEKLLVSHGLEGITIESVGNSVSAGKKQEPADEDFAATKAKALQTVLLSLASWPAAFLDPTLPRICAGDAGVRGLVQEVVEDKMNFHGLSTVAPEKKAEIVGLIMQTPLPQAFHDTLDFSAAMQAEAKELMRTRPVQPMLQRWSEKASMIYAFWKHSRTMNKNQKGNGFYVIYAASKGAGKLSAAA